MPEPSKHDLFFDIEGLDKILNSEESEQDKQALEYLFGIYDHDNKKEPYKYFWAHNQDEEKEKFIKLLEFLSKHLEKYPDSHIYHYNHYEKTALTKLMTKHDTQIEQVNDLLRYNKLVDLHAVVNQGIQVSEREYSLKNLEKFYQYKRKGEIKKANESTDKYLDWIETAEEKLLEDIKLYNREDCESTYYLREWLTEIKPKDSIYAVKKEPEIREKNWEKENKARFVCSMTIFFPNGKNFTSKGIINGRISKVKKGKKGFGYDPIFIPIKKKITFGQMLRSKKMKMDHRFIAFKKLKRKIKTL